ncbi:MAG: type II toxin-antitoxin system PemK/MazF family toxin [Bryobacteraceae bacterium]
MTMNGVVRGDVVEVNLDPTVGTEIKKMRPCVVVQNNVGNKHSRRTIIVPATGAEHVAKPFAIHVPVTAGEGGFSKPSMVLCDQIRAVDKSRLVRSLGRLSSSTMGKLDAALKISLALK